METMITLLWWQIAWTAVAASIIGYVVWQEGRNKSNQGDYGSVAVIVLLGGGTAIGWLAWLIAYLLVLWLA